MNTPLVSVVTPVHNGEPYLAECIESVLQQTYPNWHYVIVNNCSTDASLEIAQRYARKYPRISILDNACFVSVIENHNIAVSQIAPEAKYCKVVSADDWIFPECLARMVELAEENPSIGIVNSYHLGGNGLQWEVSWSGIPSGSSVFPGREICRYQLLGGPYLFGCPTSTLYRADLVKTRKPFYPNVLPHADASVCYECLQDTDFGFVHQVLSFVRVHAESISSDCNRLHTFETTAALRNMLSYGPIYLKKAEYEARLEEVLSDYYRILAVSFFNFENRRYWDFHRKDLADLGYRCFGSRFFKAAFLKLIDLLLNPKQTIEKLLRRTNFHSLEGSAVRHLPQHPTPQNFRILPGRTGESLGASLPPGNLVNK